MSWALGVSQTTTDVVDQSQSESRSASIGDLSSNNKITSGDYYEQGLVGDNLSTVISAIQSTTEKAIEAANSAYAESKSEARNILEGLKPIALYMALGAALYFAIKR